MVPGIESPSAFTFFFFFSLLPFLKLALFERERFTWCLSMLFVVKLLIDIYFIHCT